MSSGKAHRRASIGAAAGAAILGMPMVGLNALKVAVGCLLGVVLSPDLDHHATTESEKVMMEIPVIGKMFFWYWWPYERLLSHGHFVSHCPVFGTAIRVFYAIIPIVIACIYFEKTIPWDWYIFWGLVLSDTLHWIMDIGKNER